MPTRPPGLTESEPSPYEAPVSFMAVVVSIEPNALLYKGAHMEFFIPSEGPASVAVGDRVRCVNSHESMQIFVIEVTSS